MIKMLFELIFFECRLVDEILQDGSNKFIKVFTVFMGKGSDFCEIVSEMACFCLT